MSDPLKGLKPTPGPVTVDEYGWCVRAHDGQMNVCDIRGWGWLTGKTAQGRTPDDAEKEQRANALLIADAFNTYTTTGRSPSQLTAQRDELVKALEEMLRIDWDNGETGVGHRFVGHVRYALSLVKGAKR